MAQPRFWNVWWTLTLLAAGFTLVMVILETLGVFHDLGLVLSAAGILLTLIFGFTASTRTHIANVEAAIATLHDDVRVLHPMRETLDDIKRLLADRLPARGNS